MSKIKKVTGSKYRYIILFVVSIVLSLPLGYQYQFYNLLEPTNRHPGDLPEVEIKANIQYAGTLYFEASNFIADGGIFSNGNYGLIMDRNTLEIEAYKRFQSFGMDMKHHNGFISFYEYPQNVWQKADYSRVPYATGNYVLLDEKLGFLRLIEDERGIDNHQLTILENGNFLYMVDDLRDTYKDASLTCVPDCYLLGQSIVEVTPSGQTVWQWNLLDHYQRDDFVMDDVFMKDNAILYDATHANSAELTSDNAILVSVRHQNEVIKIDRVTSEIIWRLGGKHSDFEFINDSLNGISHQHAPVILDNGNILIFDNGNDRAGQKVSRAVEYQLDIETGTATLVWEYRTPENHFAPNRGSAQRLDNGNTLINFVSRQAGNIVEVTPDGDIVLEITLPDGYASYQAQYWQE